VRDSLTPTRNAIGLSSLVGVQSTDGGGELSPWRSNLPPLDTVRAHWEIENGLHWQLDVTLREDAARNRRDNGPPSRGRRRVGRSRRVPRGPSPWRGEERRAMS